MSVTIEQIKMDSKRMASRLKHRVAMADSLIVEIEGANEQLESMRQFQDDLNALNMVARGGKTNANMINIINQESPHIREVEMENRELRTALENQQRALQHIMSKYREHTQHKIMNSKIDFGSFYNAQKNAIIKQQSDKINEMIAIMQKAVSFDESDINQERERFNKLATENKGLREMLQISQKFGSDGQGSPNGEDKSIQTDNELEQLASLTSKNDEDTKDEEMRPNSGDC